MNLILDFGNTQKKLALTEAGNLVLVQNYQEITKEIIAQFIGLHPLISSCILSSVISHPDDIPAYLRERLHFIELDEHTPVPLTNRYLTKNSLGKDRLAAAVAGASAFPGKNVLVINAGTALTFDFVNEDNEYLGGSIAPGMQMRFSALNTFTDKLPLLSYRDHVDLVGSDTEASIISGVINGIVAEIEGICHEYQLKYPELKIIMSGGDLNYLVNRLKISIFALPNIVLLGLQQILAFNDHKPQ
jgi:type III pantothenate kinase